MPKLDLRGFPLTPSLRPVETGRPVAVKTLAVLGWRMDERNRELPGGFSSGGFLVSVLLVRRKLSSEEGGQ